MKKTSKIIVTVVAIIIFFVLHSIVVLVREQSGYHTPGMIGVILLVALVGSLVAIWKRSDDDRKDTDIQKK